MFVIENNEPVITTECLLIPEFKNIWDRDKSKDKSKAYKELIYVYFATDFKSLYLSYIDKDERLAEDYMGNEKWKPDQMILKACQKYEELQQTPTMNFLKAARHAMQETENYFLNIDYTERDSKGNPVYKVTEVTKALKDCSGVKDTLDKLLEAVKKEQSNGSRARGDSIGGLYEMEED